MVCLLGRCHFYFIQQMVATLAKFSVLHISFEELVIWFSMTFADVHIFSVKKKVCTGVIVSLGVSLTAIFAAAPLNATVM